MAKETRKRNPGRKQVASTILKRSLVVKGHKTSVSLEEAFWRRFKNIAEVRGVPLTDLIAEIDDNRTGASALPIGNLSSSVRVFVLDYLEGLLVDKLMDEPKAALA